MYVDGSHIPIEKPNENDFEEYGNQKGLSSINLKTCITRWKNCDYKHSVAVARQYVLQKEFNKTWPWPDTCKMECENYCWQDKCFLKKSYNVINILVFKLTQAWYATVFPIAIGRSSMVAVFIISRNKNHKINTEVGELVLISNTWRSSDSLCLILAKYSDYFFVIFQIYVERKSSCIKTPLSWQHSPIGEFIQLIISDSSDTHRKAICDYKY